MELYILDPLWRRQYVLDKFISLIWTERYNKYGDFQLLVESTYATRSLLTPDTYLALSGSNYIMRIDSFEDDVPADGSRTLTIKGKSMEAILLDRVAKESTIYLGVRPTWDITDLPAAIARKIFHDICITGILDPGDIIPGVTEGSLIPSNIPEPVDPVTVQIKPSTVYDSMGTICDTWELGFRFLRQDTPTGLWFDVYSGSDRTSGQSLLTPVIFSPDLNNLQNTKELTSIDTAKNVAYVFATSGFEKVYADGVDPAVEGFERRILVVEVDDDLTGYTTTQITNILVQKGREALAVARTFQGFDGEIGQNSSYQYGRDYNLGDLVEKRNTDGVVTTMRVTEQIFVSDKEGVRSYPTLTANEYINTGSWLSWTSNKQWFDLNDDPTTWSEQP